MTAPALTSTKPVLSQSPPRHVLSQHAVVSLSDLPVTLERAFGALYAELARTGVEPDGPPFVIYNNLPDADEKWDIDICSPIAVPLEPPADSAYFEMPAGRVVTLLHVGPYETLGESHAQIERFLVDHQLEASGPPREFYLSEADVPPEETMTLIEWPVKEP
jgi:effector-binding domain-containing protein